MTNPPPVGQEPAGRSEPASPSPHIGQTQTVRPWFKKWKIIIPLAIGTLAVLFTLLFVVLVFFFAALDEGGDAVKSSNAETSDVTPVEGNKATAENLIVKIEKARFAKDFDKDPVIVVTYTLSNNTDDTLNFLWDFNAQAFQGGIELDDLVFGVDELDDSASSSDIKPGVTVTVEKAYKLRDESNVTVEVRKQFNFSNNDKVLDSKEFSVR